MNPANIWTNPYVSELVNVITTPGLAMVEPAMIR